MSESVQKACKKRAKDKNMVTKLYLDARSGQGPYPIKIRLSEKKSTTMLLTPFKVMPEQWNGSQVVKHPRAGAINTQLNALKADIDVAIAELGTRGMLARRDIKDVKKMIEQRLAGEAAAVGTTFGRRFLEYAKRKKGQTHVTYMYTYKVLADYCDIDNVLFEEITPQWLEKFDKWCTHKRNTKCQYYRYMRAAFNDAIDEGLTNNYPFRKFKIKSEETKDRALSLEELLELWNFPVEAYQVKYLDMFKLSFLLRGINMIDLCHLTTDNVRRGHIIYQRSKTDKPYSIKIEPEIQELLDKYKGENYLIDILDRYTEHASFLSHLNKELKKIGHTTYGKQGRKTIRPLIPGLSSYYARYTFAAIARHECGLSMDTISDLLGHSHGMAVTNIYVRKDEEKIDAAARQVIDKALYDK